MVHKTSKFDNEDEGLGEHLHEWFVRFLDKATWDYSSIGISLLENCNQKLRFLDYIYNLTCSKVELPIRLNVYFLEKLIELLEQNLSTYEEKFLDKTVLEQ